MARHHRGTGDGPSTASIVGRLTTALLVAVVDVWVAAGGSTDRRHVVGFMFGLMLATAICVQAVRDASERATIARRRARIEMVQERLALRRERYAGARGLEGTNVLREAIGLPRMGAPKPPDLSPGGFQRFVSAVEQERRATGEIPAVVVDPYPGEFGVVAPPVSDPRPSFPVSRAA